MGPAAALIYTGIPNLVFGGVFQNPIPVGAGQTSLVFTPSITYSLPDGWYAGYPDFDWIVNWGKGAVTFPVGLQVGKVIHIGRQPFSTSLQAGYNVARPANGTGVPDVNWFRVYRAVPGVLAGCGNKRRMMLDQSPIYANSGFRLFSSPLLLLLRGFEPRALRSR